MGFLSRLLGKSAALAPEAPSAPALWTEASVNAWLDALESEGQPLPTEEVFEWNKPATRLRSDYGSGRAIEWAIQARATTAVRRLLAHGGLKARAQRPLMDFFGVGAPNPDPESVPILHLLLGFGEPVTTDDAARAIWRGDDALALAMLPHLRQPLGADLARIAVSVGASDALMVDLIAAGLAFDRDDLCTNLSFQLSAGDDRTRAARVDRWLRLLEAHRSSARASALSEELPSSRRGAIPKRRF